MLCDIMSKNILLGIRLIASKLIFIKQVIIEYPSVCRVTGNLICVVKIEAVGVST